MSILRGYTSDSDEDEAAPNAHENAAVTSGQEPPTKKLKSDTTSITPLSQLSAQHEQEQAEIKLAKAKAKQLKAQRRDQGHDPWASYTDESQSTHPPPAHTPRQPQSLAKNNKNTNADDDDDDDIFRPTSEFVGSQEIDYQGRSFTTTPQDLKDLVPGAQECFTPKTIIHTFTRAHQHGVNKLCFFPRSGHLLLSCGNDGSIKLWSTHNGFELMRIYKGHKLAVRDISFNSTGTKFLSCGYDKLIRLWDTHSGKVERTLELTSIPHVLTFHPQLDSEFVVGLSNHKILHYDFTAMNFRSPVQVYDHHVGAINALMPMDSGFVSTADDKTVRVWRWRINNPIKTISDAALFSMPALKHHPKSSYIALQSMDNRIKVVSARGKFKWNKNKVYVGHHCAGYGIDIDFSPDGKIIMSGDSKGYAYFWDWQSKKLVNRIKLATQPIKTITSHPLESSKVAVAGNSGDIYYLD
ncbi:uncharacterized protein LODBEIA_P13580 [Lodderomyces beijingensis]|uniref:Pre-mRNA splicing factor n=1 Tax=Lodderomyces beijingensis TaxID=1775926 RepID=A0ABP0ZG28_9ASCO